MDFIKSTIMGVVQGATEFLPVSSSAHLVFSQHYLGFKNPQILFNVLLHFATLMAVLIYFREDIGSILRNFYKLKEIKSNGHCRTFWFVAAGSVPTAVIGYVFRDNIEEIFGNITVVALLLVFTGLLVFISDRIRRTTKNEIQTTIIDVIIIGTVQGLAILPGISRSGITIVVALLLGFNRRWAAKFSFLLAIPAIIGATVLELTRLTGDFNGHLVIIYSAGVISAFVVGYLSLRILMKILESRKLSYFSYYCWLIAAIVLLQQIL